MADEERGFSIELGPELDDPATQRWGDYADGDVADIEPMKGEVRLNGRTASQRFERREARQRRSRRIPGSQIEPVVEV